MAISDKSAYVNGLAEGMELNAMASYGKMMSATLEVLNEVSDSVTSFEYDMYEIKSAVVELQKVTELLKQQVLTITNILIQAYPTQETTLQDVAEGKTEQTGQSDNTLDEVEKNVETLTEMSEKKTAKQEEVPAPAAQPEDDAELIYSAVCPTCGKEHKFSEAQLALGFLTCDCGTKLELASSDSAEAEDADAKKE